MGEMTHEEMMTALDARLDEARGKMVRALGVPIILTIEGLGYRVVPAWVVDSLKKALKGPGEGGRDE